METVHLHLSNCRAYFLVSGVANLLAAVVWIFVGFVGGLLTCGLGCLLLFVPILHICSPAGSQASLSAIASTATSSGQSRERTRGLRTA